MGNRVCIVIDETDGEFELWHPDMLTTRLGEDKTYTVMLRRVDLPTFFVYWDIDRGGVCIDYKFPCTCGVFVAHYFDKTRAYGIYRVEDYLNKGEQLFENGPSDRDKQPSTQRPL